MKLGSKILVVDKYSQHHLKRGKIIAVYDSDYYKAEFRVVLEGSSKKLGFNQSQLRDFNDKPQYCSRGGLYRAITSGKLKGQDIVDVLKYLRDSGFIELNMPSN